MAKDVKDWGHDIGLALSMLTRAEAEVPAIARQAESRAFRQIGRWILPEQYLPPGLGRWEPPGGLLRILRADKLGQWQLRALAARSRRLMLHSAADAILLKANLRAFYLAAGITLKLPNPGRPASSERLRQEIACRSQFRQCQDVRTPGLVHVPRDEGFIAEELLRADPIARTMLDPAEVARRYLAWQDVNGLAIKSCAAAVDLEEELPILLDYCAAKRIDVKRLEAAVRAAAASGRPLVCGMCNGDLTVTNLMYAPDTLYIVDWEWASRDLILADAVRLGTQLDGYARAALAEFMRLPIAGEVRLMDPIQQYVVAVAHVAAQRLKRRQDFVSEADSTAYARRVKTRIEEIVRLGNQLAASG
jgi:hypothetical protein